MKSYQQFCAVASALDLVGDRWTLLVLRELMAGPKRFGELQHGVPGIPTNLLSSRIATLLDAGLIVQRTPAEDRRARVYDVGPMREPIREIIAALARLGLKLMPPSAKGLAFNVDWIVTALDAIHSPAHADDLVARFAVDGETVTVRFGEDGVTRTTREPSVVVTADAHSLWLAMRQPEYRSGLVARGSLGVEGPPRDVDAFLKILSRDQRRLRS